MNFGSKRNKERFEEALSWIGLLVFLFLLIGGRRLLGWSFSFSLFAALGYALIVFILQTWLWKRQSKSLGVRKDPVLGEVSVRRSDWDGEFRPASMHPDLGDITVSGEGFGGPSVMQKSTFVEVKDGWSQWMDVLENALDQHQDPVVSARPREIFPDEIILADEELAWSLRFTISGEREFLDLLAEFQEGTVRVKILQRFEEN